LIQEGRISHMHLQRRNKGSCGMSILAVLAHALLAAICFSQKLALAPGVAALEVRGEAKPEHDQQSAIDRCSKQAGLSCQAKNQEQGAVEPIDGLRIKCTEHPPDAVARALQKACGS
jgi:hypothetical protein